MTNAWCRDCKMPVSDKRTFCVAQNHRIQKAPGLRSLERMAFDGIAKTPDGCRVEPDGRCPHGQPNWLMIVGVI